MFIFKIIGYGDRHFVVISQVKKLGTLIQAWSENSLETSSKRFRITTMFGRRDDPLLDVYARQIIEQISTYSEKPLLLAISLIANGRDTETFQLILNKLLEICTWT